MSALSRGSCGPYNGPHQVTVAGPELRGYLLISGSRQESWRKYGRRIFRSLTPAQTLFYPHWDWISAQQYSGRSSGSVLVM
ncbi:putative [Escherichia phage Mu]|uniref:Bacteriophage Mu left end n=1 Tax=Escherichia phage Mu TaxID=2681603 RepID=Q38489_BPMU|nr:putative [Escherichia phage Mu]